jgi:phosphoenolpyruvate synthase/pyruvate phosphate dikinase
MKVSIYRIDDVPPDQYPGIGAKATSLARLRSLRFPVPEAYVLPVGFLKDASTNELESAIKPILSKLAPPWIVRSSATVEDGRGASFAGIFKTVLGLETARDVANAANAVLANTEQGVARDYARQRGITPNSIGMAIVVQHMLLPFASGVAFTRHPLEGRRVTAIEATYGLGSSLVEGQVEPDFAEVDLQERVDFIRLGSKLRMTTFHSGSIKVVSVEESERSRPAITHAQAREIARIARRVEKEFGVPQDVEWAIENGSIFVVQARPITRLF